MRALAVAEEKGYRWENVAGTSAVAIIAALVAAGYTAHELREVMAGSGYSLFKDTGALDRVPELGPLVSFLAENGASMKVIFSSHGLVGYLGRKG